MKILSEAEKRSVLNDIRTALQGRFKCQVTFNSIPGYIMEEDMMQIILSETQPHTTTNLQTSLPFSSQWLFSDELDIGQIIDRFELHIWLWWSAHNNKTERDIS